MANLASSLQIWGLGKRRITTREGTVLLFDKLPSTMDAARHIVEIEDNDVVAVQSEFQSKGRGRQGKPWLAPPGECLLITYIIPRSKQTVAHLSFGAGLAVAEAVAELSGALVTVKWPNDVLVGGKKIAGVMIESFIHSGETRFLVGVGINANVPNFPSELKNIATSIEIESGLLTDIAELEHLVRQKLFGMFDQPWHEVLGKWRERDASKGIVYRTIIENSETTGVYVGVTDDGLLVLDTPAGRISCISATSATETAGRESP